ncbi:Protein C3orf33 [Clonorchis sinensis]|uniref:Protein C3orf33 n=1 Tax=Clonorchis sinensis TaxID=79923 RepID=A0A8T1MHZ6_CLOSI|nr:Protein C3orf33 [Clonorchis sinensis]
MRSIIDRLQKLVDDHLRIVRLVPSILGLCGLVLISKHYYLFSRFRSVFEIPNELFTRRLKLRGVVASVSFDGELKIIHLPRMCFIYRSDADCALPVVLPLTHSRRSIEWMRATFTGQPQIRFVPIGLDHANGRLVAMIYVKQRFFSKDIAVFLLSEGLSSLSESHFKLLPETLQASYEKVQTKAIVKKKGMWWKDSKDSRLKRFFRRMFGRSLS